jgi:hypothetical protein
MKSDASSKTFRVFLYFAPLTLLVQFVVPQGYLLDITTSYMLKNQLHATATQVSAFRLLTAVPVYLGFLFGLTRDLWSPFGLRDRGYFLLFAPLTAAVFVWMALSPISHASLYAGMFLVMVTFRFVAAAHQGLIALIGQERLMTGRLAALWQFVGNIPAAAGAFASGYAAENLEPRQTLLAAAGIALLIGVMGPWKPRAVFDHTYDKPLARGAGFRGDVARLVRHKAIYPVAAIILLFQFGPAQSTPLQFHLSNGLHAPDSAYAYFWTSFLTGIMPAFVVYGFLCKRLSLRTLLWWGTILAVPQWLTFPFIHSARTAIAMAAPMGLVAGIGYAAIYDLAMRSCPAGMQGTLMMLVTGADVLSTRASDVVGSLIYDQSNVHGFLYSVIATAVSTALVLPFIALVPRDLVANADGQASPLVGADVPAG